MEELLAIIYRSVSRYSTFVEYGESSKIAHRDSITITTKEGKFKIKVEKL